MFVSFKTTLDQRSFVLAHVLFGNPNICLHQQLVDVEKTEMAAIRQAA